MTGNQAKQPTKASRIISKIVSVLSYVVLAMSIVLLLSVTISRVQGKTPSLLGYSFHIVVTPSMSTGEPDSIDVGDVVIVKECSRDEVELNDIILFTPDTTYMVDGKRVDTVLHRVVEIQDDGTLVTKGDANPNIDPFGVQSVVGKLVNQSALLGKLMVFMLNVKNLIFVGVLAVLLITCVLIIKKIVSTGKEIQQESPEYQEREEIKKKIEQLKKITNQQNTALEDAEHAVDTDTEDEINYNTDNKQEKR
ncbi:MAG: signal peptidase I [Clostridia bacterium]|nr:signal peptidase I [Clostridia bacterium]